MTADSDATTCLCGVPDAAHQRLVILTDPLAGQAVKNADGNHTPLADCLKGTSR